MPYEEPLEASELPDPEDLGSDGDSVDLERCPSCGESIYEDSEQCPHCGEWIIRKTRPAGWAWTVLVILVLVIFIMAFVLW